MSIFKKIKGKKLLAFIIAITLILTSFSVPIVRNISESKPNNSSQDSSTGNSSGNGESKDKISEDEIAKLNAQIKKTPDSTDLYVKRASHFSILQKYDEAIADYTKAIELDPKANTYYLRAVCYIVETEYLSAYEDLKTALTYEPDNVDYLSFMADVCSALKKYDENITVLGKLLAKDSKNAILYAMAGDTCVYLSDIDGAISHYDNAIKYYSDATSKAGISKESLYAAKGNCLKTNAQYSDAINAYNQSLKIAETISLYFQRGFCLIQLGQYEEAIKDFTKAIDKNYEVPLSKFQRGLCYYSTGKYQKAIDDFSAYEAAFPDKTDSFLYKGLCLQQLKKYSDAISYLEKSILAGTAVGDCNFNIGNCYYNQEKYAESISYYTKAIELNAQIYPAYLNRGLAYVKTNKYNEAKEDLKKVIDECPDKDLAATASKNYEPIKNITIITK